MEILIQSLFLSKFDHILSKMKEFFGPEYTAWENRQFENVWYVPSLRFSFFQKILGASRA